MIRTFTASLGKKARSVPDIPKAIQYLLKRTGIECSYVAGEAIGHGVPMPGILSGLTGSIIIWMRPGENLTSKITVSRKRASSMTISVSPQRNFWNHINRIRAWFNIRNSPPRRPIILSKKINSMIWTNKVRRIALWAIWKQRWIREKNIFIMRLSMPILSASPKTWWMKFWVLPLVFQWGTVCRIRSSFIKMGTKIQSYQKPHSDFSEWGFCLFHRNQVNAVNAPSRASSIAINSSIVKTRSLPSRVTITMAAWLMGISYEWW